MLENKKKKKKEKYCWKHVSGACISDGHMSIKLLATYDEISFSTTDYDNLLLAYFDRIIF